MDQRIREIDTLLGDGTLSKVSTILDKAIWAEDEIDRTVRKHPDKWDVLYHSFPLLHLTHNLMIWGADFVYESHVRELLGHIVREPNMRAKFDATWAEIACYCSDASQESPMTNSGAGLYFRALAKAFPDQPQFIDQVANRQHYESLYGEDINRLEQDVRYKLFLFLKDRTLSGTKCGGYHHGVPAPLCRYRQEGRTERAA